MMGAMKIVLIALTTIAVLLANLEARAWKSADGSKTFEGTLRSYDAESGDVTVILSNGSPLTFSQEKLSDADIAFVKEWHATQNAADPAEAVVASVVGSQVAKAKLHRLEGKRFKKAELDKAPEYYILYYSASW